jgi:hypothetical protein
MNKLFVSLFFVNCSLLFAADFSLSTGGFAIFPLGDNSAHYKIGGGGSLGFELDIASILSNKLGIGYTIGVESGMLFSPFAFGDGQLNFYSAGGTMGLYYFLFSRIPLRIDGGIGFYTANDGEEKAPAGLWYRYGAETGFRFTPGFMLTAGGGWRQFQGTSRPLNSGYYAGLGARFTFGFRAKSTGGVSVLFSQADAVYPVLTPLYQQFPVGTVTVRNNENAEIRNIQLFFRAGSYTASEFPCGSAALIPKGRSTEMPLYADFSPEVLRFADSGRILGELVIRYTFLGRERESVRTVSVAVHNRNTTVPGDNTALAAFISPTSPEVLQFARYVSALARTKHRMGLNFNMETGIYMFEAIRVAVKREQRDVSKIEEVQFPSQTLAYGLGTVRDIALLYAASLEAVGIESALIIFPDGEILGAANLGIKRDDAVTAALFNGPDKLLVIGDGVWLPVSMSRLNNGFTAAWQDAIRRIDNLLESGESAEMIFIEDAWEHYPPVPFPALGIRLALPNSNSLSTASDTVIQNYISAEFTPKLTAVQEQIRRRPAAALYNQLGNLYLRSGMIPQAKSAYEQAAGMGSVGSMVNRGTIAIFENDIALAERWFLRALAREPANNSALRGIEFVEVRK